MNPPIDCLEPSEQMAPLSYAQQRLWLVDRLTPTGSAYNVEQVLRLNGELDAAALRGALNEVVRRHEVLRTRFGMRDGQPAQVIAPELAIELAVEDLREIAPGEREREAQRRAQAEAAAPFDLERGPLIRARLLRLAPSEHWLLLTLHHIVTDGWSSGVLTRELTALYGSLHRGEASPLPPLPVQYADYAVWQRQWLEGEALGGQLAYWRRTLAGLPLLDLPTDRPRPVQASYRGGRIDFEVPEALTRSLKGLSRREGATLFMTLLAAYQVLLFRCTGQEDVAVGVPTAGRTRPQLETLIGFFVNTLVLRGDLSGNPGFTQYLGQVRARALDAYSHQDLPFEKLVEELAPRRDLSRNPLFQASLALQNTPPGHWELPGLDVKRLEGIHTGSAKFDLAMSLTERGGALTGGLEYASDLFDAATIERMTGHFVRLLEGIVADPQCRVDELPLLAADERRRLLVERNATAADFPRDRCLHELFEAQAARTPQAVAVEFEDRRLTYAELDARANQLAHHLRSKGIGADVLVGICMERSVELVVGLLGVLKAGGAYVPLDPGYPAARLAFMLEDARASVLVTAHSLLARLPPPTGHVVCVDRDGAAIAMQPATKPSGTTTARNLAYVIYTSGSTGTPKGVMIEHRALVNHMEWMRRTFGFDHRDSVLQKTPISFDAAVWEFFAPLLYGGRLVMAPPDAHRDPAAIVRALREHEVTTLQMVPSLFRLLVREPLLASCGTLARVFCGGEALPAEVAQSFLERSDARLYNLYGPTETCIDSLFWECRRGDGGATVPIGRPIANTRVHVLDEHRQPVPEGVAGELYIGGAGLARGYLGQPERTAERFVADPFAPEPGAKLYRSGDRARYRPDGSIEFLGRLDHQLKLRGFRIEPGEIEAVLARHPDVREALVLLREDVPGDPRLVAYVVAQGDMPVAADLRTALMRQLPDYMVPAAFVQLPALPLTANGKVDRMALPAPGAVACSSRPHEAPVGAVETALAQVWADLLGVERVGRHDHFFELGGHSLLAVGMIERMRQAGLHADVRAIFLAPTLADLAAAVGSGGGNVEIPPDRMPPGCDAITPEMLPLVQLTPRDIDRIARTVPGGAANIRDIYPLAPLQEGILFHHMMATEGDPYLLSALLAFDSRERLQRYLEALQAVIDRHDILRTAVLWEGLPEPVQVVWRRARLAVEEVGIVPAAGDVARQLRAHFDPRHYRLDVRQAPLMRAFIAHDAANARWVMLRLFHHLSNDHVTEEVVQQEIDAHLLGQAAQLPAPLPFRNFVAQARLGVSRAEHAAFFQQMLGDVDEPTAPFGLTDVYGDGSDIAEARRPVDASLATRLRERVRALGVSAASVFHLAWAQVLARASGRDDVVFGTVLFGRMQGGSGADRVLGLFINTLPVRIRVGDESVQDSVRHAHSLLGQLLRHEHASLALAQRCSAVAPPAPLFSAILNFRHSAAEARIPAEALRARKGIERLGGEDRTNYPLALSVDDLGDGFALKVQVRSRIDPQRVCAFMHTALLRLVDALESAPTTPLRNLDVLPPAERHRLLVEWNAIAADFPRDRCLHELFEAQAARQPDAVAVVFEDSQLAYGELDTRANQLAHLLRSLGVGPDTLVAICVERSLEMVVGLLGILKAGGAYVPLDPGYPAARLAFMLEDTRAPVLLTQQRLLGQLPPHAGHTVCLDRDWPTVAAQPATPPPATATAANLAYVIYTSGSTGTPKGVMVTHANVARLFSATQPWFDFDARDTWTCFHSVAFDFSVWEIWGALTYGGRLIVVPYLVSRDPAAFHALLRREGVTVLNQTPSAFRQLIAADAAVDAAGLVLRLVIFGGEALEMQSLRPWLDRHGDAQPRLVNMYGITETTVHVTYRPVRRADLDTAAGCMIGVRIPDLRVHLLDRHLQPVPIGIPGEIHVGGAGVARGYLNRAELTAERFVADPFAGDPAARLYRSGDLARFTPDGDLEYLGRIDDQVKIRGFRIELGEIEAVLARHPDVREALVLPREDVPGAPRLVAYVIARGDPIAAADLRAFAGQFLPDYMLPSAVVPMDVLPLSPNGKVDRKRLPAPGFEDREPASEPPCTPIEKAIADIWAEVLNLPRLGRNDNFFDLGGHSLLAVQAIGRVNRALAIDLTLRQLFETPSVRGLALAALDRMVAGAVEDVAMQQGEAPR